MSAVKTVIPDDVWSDRVGDFNVYDPDPEGTGYDEAWPALRDRSLPLTWPTACAGRQSSFAASPRDLSRNWFRSVGMISSRISRASFRQSCSSSWQTCRLRTTRSWAAFSKSLSTPTIFGLGCCLQGLRSLARPLIQVHRCPSDDLISMIAAGSAGSARLSTRKQSIWQVERAKS